ncbi:MAG: DUF1653 domain-containing protein [Candidatus Dependentiae bacterium]|nr:DUF1653 domain-containing protein [Candidatus Dependentiae bacterium]
MSMNHESIPLIEIAQAIEQGAMPETGQLYRHYKGNYYKIIGIGHHTETLQKVVMYQALYDSEDFGDHALWARPLGMFIGTVTIDGKELLRFEKVQE